MKRLVKKAIMDVNVFENALNQLSTKGRDVLKSIEDYKFTIEQTTRLMTNDQHLAQKIIQKKKVLDQAAGLIYSVVFDIENIDITKEYQDQVEEVNNGPENIPENKDESKPEQLNEKSIQNEENIEKSNEEKPIDKREKTPEKKPKEKSKESEDEKIED